MITQVKELDKTRLPAYLIDAVRYDRSLTSKQCPQDHCQYLLSGYNWTADGRAGVIKGIIMKALPPNATKIDLNLFYVYALVDPRDNQVKYVGQSKSPISRHRSHKRSKHNKALVRWIKRLKEKNQLPDLYILESVLIHETIRQERYWIQYFGIENLFNQTDGLNIERKKLQSLLRMQQKATKPAQKLFDMEEPIPIDYHIFVANCSKLRMNPKQISKAWRKRINLIKLLTF